MCCNRGLCAHEPVSHLIPSSDMQHGMSMHASSGGVTASEPSVPAGPCDTVRYYMIQYCYRNYMRTRGGSKQIAHDISTTYLTNNTHFQRKRCKIRHHNLNKATLLALPRSPTCGFFLQPGVTSMQCRMQGIHPPAVLQVVIRCLRLFAFNTCKMTEDGLKFGLAFTCHPSPTQAHLSW